MTKISECDYQKIIDLYVGEENSMMKISKIFDVSYSTIRRLLEKNNIQRRSRCEMKLKYIFKKNQESIDRGNRIKELYFEGKSSTEIMKELGIKSHSIVLRNLKRLGIKRRTISESIKLKYERGYINPKLGKRMELDLKSINKKHWNEKKSLKDISKEIGVSCSSIGMRLKESGYLVRSSKETSKLESCKKKISIANKGKKPSEETKIKMTNGIKKWHEENRGTEKYIKKYIIGNRGMGNPFYEKTHTELSKQKISANHQGIDLKDWKKFISFEPYDKNFNLRFKNLIRKRDNQICMTCGTHREKLKRALSVHHINYDKKLTISQNCISLCDSCHLITQTNRDYWTNFFQSLLLERYGYEYLNGDIIINLQKVNSN